ncbi:hypothetical protein CBL_01813 [Carabus blaptoides fortunei]
MVPLGEIDRISGEGVACAYTMRYECRLLHKFVTLAGVQQRDTRSLVTSLSYSRHGAQHRDQMTLFGATPSTIQSFLACGSLASQFSDLAPCDFWLFPELRMPLKGIRFQSREDKMQKSPEQLRVIPKKLFSDTSGNGRSVRRRVKLFKGSALKRIAK